jgi:hypothetical protein
MKGWNIKDLENSPVAHLNPHLFGKTEPTKKKAKYNNVKTTDEFGNVYDSKKEAKRAKELRLLLKAGEIGFLARQVEFDLGGVGKYVADFVYTNKAGKQVVEDVKSEATKKLSTYRLKRKLMLKIHGITIKEV